MAWWQTRNTFLPLPEPQLFDIRSCEMGLRLWAVSAWLHLGGGTQWMNVLVIACHHIMEKTAYFTDCAKIPLEGRARFWWSEEWMYCEHQESHSFIWLFLASVVWLMVMADSSSYLWANRAITFTEEDPLTQGSDGCHWIELPNVHPAPLFICSFGPWLYQLLSPMTPTVSLELNLFKTQCLHLQSESLSFIKQKC